MNFEPIDNCAAHRCLSRRRFLAAAAAAPAA
ncbi:MAG: twin-arginine translocation signal domain-containing protein, partial [Planctomycetes bacterium]|nr:twin-arginine translocation signal domain-containing protein [Planctomycetota bacterium]